MAVVGAPAAQEWLIEVKLEAEREPKVEELIEFRDRVWRAGGALRRAAGSWTVALIVLAAGHEQAAKSGRAKLRELRCGFARFAGLEASPVA